MWSENFLFILIVMMIIAIMMIIHAFCLPWYSDIKQFSGVYAIFLWLGRLVTSLLSKLFAFLMEVD